MSFVAVAGLGAAAMGSVTSIALANKQKRQADAVRNSASDPGIQPNYGLIRANQMLADNYSNYQLPGLTRYQQQIASQGATAMSNVRQAATSSEDVLDAATRVQAGANEATQDLYTNQAQGRLQALDRYINSTAQLGQDGVRMNTMELDRYDATLREAAALQGASYQNMNSGVQDLLTGLGPVVQSFLPTYSVNPNTGEMMKGKSKYQSIFGN